MKSADVEAHFRQQSFIAVCDPSTSLRQEGPAAIRQVTADFCADHAVKITVCQIIIQGQRAAVEWSWHETHRSTGEYSQAEDVIVVEVTAGKIQRWREYIDTQARYEPRLSMVAIRQQSAAR